MEDKKKYPSLPSNYVTLVQLQDRWIKEQQLKQIENEQQEQERRREEQRLEEDQENQKHNDNEERCEAFSKSIPRRPLRRYRRPYNRRTIEVSHRGPEEPEARVEAEAEAEAEAVVVIEEDQENQKHNDNEERCEAFSKSIPRRPLRRSWRPYNRSTIEVSHRDPEEPEARAEAVVVIGDEIHDQERKRDDSKKKKNKNKGKKNRKPKREEEVTRGTEKPALEKVEEKNIPVRIDGERKGMRGEFRWKKKNVSKDKVSEPEDHLMVEIGRNFEDLSMDREKEGGKNRPRVEMNGGRGSYRGSGRFRLGGGGVWKPRDSSFVWVRKGEISDGNVAGIRGQEITGVIEVV